MGVKFNPESVSMLSFSTVAGNTTKKKAAKVIFYDCEDVDFIFKKRKTKNVPLKEVYGSNLVLKQNVLLMKSIMGWTVCSPQDMLEF